MNASSLSPSSRYRQAFTLVEVLSVVAIITILIAVATPSMLGAIKATRLSTAGDLLVGKLAEAQGFALTFSSDVEVRLYEAPATELDDGSSGQTLQLFHLKEVEILADDPAQDQAIATFEPDGEKVILPVSVAISANPKFSSIWKLPRQVERTADGDRSYVAIRFHPDGSTNLAELQNWHLTLVEHPVQKVEELSANFFTIQIDPTNGRVDTYRPE